MKIRNLIGTAAFAFLSTTAVISAQNCGAAGTVGTGGSAAASDTSASSVGTAGTCQTGDGTTSSIGSGGSAAATDGRAMSKTHVNNTNGDKLKAQTKSQAMDKGTFSKSRTKTSTDGDNLESTTRTMSHEPGQKPAKSTTTQKVILPQR